MSDIAIEQQKKEYKQKNHTLHHSDSFCYTDHQIWLSCEFLKEVNGDWSDSQKDKKSVIKGVFQKYPFQGNLYLYILTISYRYKSLKTH